MSNKWNWPIARFRHAVSKTNIGTGVLCVGDVVLTCEHVVRAVLEGSQVKAEVGAELSVDFPFAGLYGLTAKVAKLFPEIPEAERRRDSPPSDLAILTIDTEKVETIEPCVIAQSDPVPGADFSGHGFPSADPSGDLAEGNVLNQDPGGWIDVIGKSQLGHFVEPGFSGAPVFAGQGEEIQPGEVIGLCVTADISEKRVAKLIPPTQLAAVLRTIDRASPYRWLKYFSRRDAAYFFGREELNKDLWQQLMTEHFLLLAGPAGSGKSSLLRAGLMVNAQRSDMETLTFRPLANVKAELVRALGLQANATDKEIHDEIEIRVSRKRGLAIGIDQAEELVRRDNVDQSEKFLGFLAELLGDFKNLYIALAARSDDLPGLLQRQPMRLLEKNLRYIDQLNGAELRAAIERPAQRLQVRFVAGLTTRIVNDALKEPRVPLPVVQMCLSLLWKNCTSPMINTNAYDAIGGLTGALANHANSVLDQMRAKAEGLPVFSRFLFQMARMFGLSEPKFFVPFLGDAVPDGENLKKLPEVLDQLYGRILLQLVEVGDKGEDLRRRVRLSDFKPLETGIVRSLAEGRLVIISHDSASEGEIVEFAHDSLLTAWDKLRDLIEVRRDHLRLRSQLQREAVYWNARGRPAAYRWSDERALDVAGMMKQFGYEPSSVEMSFLGPVDLKIMLAKLTDAVTTHEERATIGVRLALLGDTRTGTGVKDGLPTFVWCGVPSGRVVLSDDAGEFEVDSFDIAKYPVTYAQYRAFLEARDGYKDRRWWEGLEKRYYEEPGRQIPILDNHPAVNVDWMEAVAYSRWVSHHLHQTIRLPTEWERQLAATRGRPDFEFPWGPNWDDRRANTYENNLNRTVAVGLYPQDVPPDAPLDLAGNVWEWCINEFCKPVPLPQIAFAGLKTRAIRGGAGSAWGKYTRTSYRNHYRPDYRFDALGFRLMRASSSPESANSHPKR